MTIDKKKLVDLLVEKTSMSRQEIKKQLDQLIERILDAAKRGKALEIKEFGLFYFDEEGELKFEASEELSTEISFKYAGMKPVEIKPERDTAISAVEEQQDEEAEEEYYEPEEDDKDIFESGEFDDTEEDDFSDIEKEDEKDILEDPFAPEPLEPLEEPVEEEPKSKIEDTKPSPRQPVRKRNDHTGIFILLVIIILAVLIGGYFYYVATQTQELDDVAEPPATQTETQMGNGNETGLTTEETTSSPADNQIDESSPVEEQQQTAEQSEAQAPSEQEEVNEVSEEDTPDGSVSISETDQSMYGLMGSVIEEANDGYSIVVHSFTTEETAQSAAQRLLTEGYRVIVNARMVNGSTVWRVSVGQFETLEGAQQATTQLPNPYNTQNFIQRIQLN